jgi:predicted GIY-YIG superfamily endonuclease
MLKKVYNSSTNFYCLLNIPLKLAWYISIHKSQGLSLTKVEVNLEKAFGYGMVYVALSRASSIQGLRIRGFDTRKIKVNNEVIKADKRGYRGCNTWIDRDKLKRLHIKSDNPNFKCKFCDGSSIECEELSSSNGYNSSSNKRAYESDNTPGVYVLRLRDDKYYVGQSDNKRRRIGEHRECRGEGTEFTKKHAVVEEIKPLTETMTDLNLWELKETLTRMKVQQEQHLKRKHELNSLQEHHQEHGIHSVRGSRWCQLVLQQNHIEDIKNYMETILNLCYRCLSDSHYANECIASQEHFL